MNYKFKVTSDAETDLSLAMNWYEVQRKGLGSEFVLSFDAARNIIQRSPNSYIYRYKNIRGVLLKRFPYLALYEIVDDTIIVVAVFHTSRNPKHWKKRK